MTLFIVAVIVFVLNIPFGYWRAYERKFSFYWWMAIHTPIPIVVLIRLYTDIGFAFHTYPVLIGAFFIGQWLGAFIYKKRKYEKRKE